MTTTIDAAPKVGRRELTASDHAIAAEWNLTLRPDETGSVVGIYHGRWKVASYNRDTKRLSIGFQHKDNVTSLFDAVMTIASLSIAGSDLLPCWLRS